MCQVIAYHYYVPMNKLSFLSTAVSMQVDMGGIIIISFFITLVEFQGQKNGPKKEDTIQVEDS